MSPRYVSVQYGRISKRCHLYTASVKQLPILESRKMKKRYTKKKKYYYYYPSDGSFRQVNFTFSKFGIREKKSFFEKALSHPGVPIPTYSYLGTLIENQYFFFLWYLHQRLLKKYTNNRKIKN